MTRDANNDIPPRVNSTSRPKQQVNIAPCGCIFSRECRMIEMRHQLLVFRNLSHPATPPFNDTMVAYTDAVVAGASSFGCAEPWIITAKSV